MFLCHWCQGFRLSHFLAEKPWYLRIYRSAIWYFGVMYMASYPNEVALKSILLGSEISVKLTHFASNKWNYWHRLL